MKYPAWVYIITIRGAPPKYYVGLSSNPAKRFEQHQNMLRAGKHPVEDMQADYNASTKKELIFFQVEEVRTKSERFKEHRWQIKMQSYDREHGYNYKDPTARTEMAAAEQKKQVKATLKKRIQKSVYPQGNQPIPLSVKRLAEAREYLSKMTDDEIKTLVGCI